MGPQAAFHGGDRRKWLGPYREFSLPLRVDLVSGPFTFSCLQFFNFKDDSTFTRKQSLLSLVCF